MLRVAIRGVADSPLRYLASIIAIALGIGFFTATSVLTISFQDSLDRAITGAFERADGVVRSSQSFPTESGEVRGPVPASTADRIAGLDGVASAAPYLTGYAQAVTAGNETVGAADAGARGYAWIDDPRLNPFEVVEGAAPVAPDEVVIDAETFAEGGFAIGDEIRILPLPAEDTFTIVGTIADRGGALPGESLAFSAEGAGRLFGTSDVDQILVRAAEGLSPAELVRRLGPQLPTGTEAATVQTAVDELRDQIGSRLTFVFTALQTFAAVALFVCALVIYNTFSITVAQRTRELALLRAIGATGRQVSRSVLLESLIVGAIASSLGVVLGIGLGWGLVGLFSSPGFSIDLSLPATALVAGIALGAIITAAAAWLPARRGMKVAPIAALREAAAEPRALGAGRALVGVALMALGLGLTGLVVAGGPAEALAVGCPLIVIALAVLGPGLIRPLGRLVSAPIVRRGSVIGQLARENVSRNPRRSATTSLTVMVVVTLVATGTILTASFSAWARGDADEQLRADQIVTVLRPIVEAGGGLDPSVATQIAGLPGVEAAVSGRYAQAQIDGGSEYLNGFTTAGLDEVLDIRVVDGTVSDLDADEIAIDDGKAAQRGLEVGDEVEVRLERETTRLTVAGTYDSETLVGAWIVDTALLDAGTDRRLDSLVYVAGDGAEATSAAIENLLADNPTAEVLGRDAFIDEQVGILDELLSLAYRLLGLSVLVALIGIVNTLALSILERTRELGLLRAVGMTDTQMRRTIRYESAIIALTGTLLGLALGAFFGWLTVEGPAEGSLALTMPWGALLIIAIAGLVAGLLAGELPARRAGRLDVLHAIADE